MTGALFSLSAGGVVFAASVIILILSAMLYESLNNRRIKNIQSSELTATTEVATGTHPDRAVLLYLGEDLPHDAGSGNIGAALTEAAINRLSDLLSQPVDDPDEQALRADAGNMLLETYQRRLHYNYSDEQTDVGLELMKRTRLEKFMQREAIIAQRNELFRMRKARTISDTAFHQTLRAIDLKEESLH